MADKCQIPAGSVSENGMVVSQYTVVLRSRSGCRVRFGGYIDLRLPDGCGGEAQVRISTRWQDLGLEFPVPRELWMAVTVNAADIDAAVRSAAAVASTLAVIISFCVNAVVEPPALHVVFNSTSGLSRREFMEAFLPDETGHPRPGRWIDVEGLLAFGQAAYSSSEAPRLFRALAQYQAALRYWNTGSRVLVLAHLYIACEVLTKAVQRLHQARLGLTELQHAQLLGVDTTQSNWKMMAGFFARREYIFEGDKSVYDAARSASDQFEHGTADLGNVRQAADAVTRDLFDLVRSAVLSLVPALDPAICDTIMAKAPVDVSPLHKQITGYIVSDQPSDPGNLGMPGESFPALRWRSDVRACRLEGDNLTFDPVETITVQFADGLRFEGGGYAIYGGLNPAPGRDHASSPARGGPAAWAARELSVGDEGLQMIRRDLTADVMPLIDAAAASGAGIAQEFPRAIAFNLFGQGVAFFQGAQALIAAGQPVEALLLLRELVIVAARFEQVADAGTLGLVIRLALDNLPDDLPTAATARDDLLRNAASAGLRIPASLPSAGDTAIWRALAAEMQIAEAMTMSGLRAAGLHVSYGGVDQADFRTRLQPGPLTDLVMSACIIAQLNLLRHAAPVFAWTVNRERIDALLAEATDINEASAASEMYTRAVEP
ncbi:MAG: hypothetical protein ACXVHQ_21260 [Solirubrobacteraceae bacterium]